MLVDFVLYGAASFLNSSILIWRPGLVDLIANHAHSYIVLYIYGYPSYRHCSYVYIAKCLRGTICGFCCFFAQL